MDANHVSNRPLAHRLRRAKADLRNVLHPRALAARNLDAAARVRRLLTTDPSARTMIPHPVIVHRAELRNARRHVAQGPRLP